jgi:hypothetical protein
MLLLKKISYIFQEEPLPRVAFHPKEALLLVAPVAQLLALPIRALGASPPTASCNTQVHSAVATFKWAKRRNNK